MRESWFVRTLACVVLLTATLDLVRPIISYRALELGASTAQIGVIAGSYAVLSSLIAVPTGRWIDRHGEARFIVIGGLVMAGTVLFLASAGNLVALGAAQALLGAGQVFCLVAIQTLIANGSAGHERDANYGMFAFMASVGQVAGPLMAGALLSAGGDTGLVFISGVALVVPLAVLGFSLVRRPPPTAEGAAARPRPTGSLLGSAGQVLKMPSMLQAMSVSIAVMATIDILVAYVPVYGEANGIPASTVGLLLAARATASGASRLLMMPLLHRFGRRRLFIYGLLLPAVTLTALGFSANVPIAFGLMALAGFGLGLGQPMSLAWVSQAVPAEQRGTALGVRLTGNRVGQILLPVGVGAIGGAAGVSAVFVALGVMLAGSAGAVMTARFPQGTSP